MKNAVTIQFTRGNFDFLASLVISASVALLFGCAGPAESGVHSRNATLAQPKLAAETTFLDGTLLAQFSFEALSFHGGPGGGGKSDGSGGSHRSRRNRGSDSPSGGGAPEDSGDDGSAMRRPNIAVARALLHVTLTNNSKETLNFAVTDVISQLGNFAIRPERFSLAPGQSGEIDPLASTFQDPLAELTVETHVRHAGKKETQTVQLLPIVGPERSGL